MNSDCWLIRFLKSWSLTAWLMTSNRYKHFVGIFIVSFFGTLLMGVGCIGGMEFKDVHYHNSDNVPIWRWDWSAWDWLDCLAGFLGGLFGQLLQGYIIYLIVK